MLAKDAEKEATTTSATAATLLRAAPKTSSPAPPPSFQEGGSNGSGQRQSQQQQQQDADMQAKEDVEGGVKNKAALQNAAAAKRILVVDRGSVWSDDLGDDHLAQETKDPFQDP